MRKIIILAEITLLASFLLGISTWFSALYMPHTVDAAQKLETIQQSYAQLANVLKLDKNAFENVVTMSMIQQEEQGLQVKKNAAASLKKAATSGNYLLQAEQQNKIAVEMQNIYEQTQLSYDNTSLLQKLRYTTVIICILSLVVLLLGRRLCKPQE